MELQRMRSSARNGFCKLQTAILQQHISARRSACGRTRAAAPDTRQQVSVAELAAEAVQGRFFIPADEVQQLQEAAGCSMDTLLLSMLDEAAQSARPLISNYKVGAVGLGGSGAVYIGVNLEIPGNALNQSVHGEQFLVANLVLHGERELRTLAISAAPCGHCRQFYSELACADSVRFVFGYRGHAAPEIFSLQQILPARFGPLDLLEDPAAPLLLEQQHHNLTWTSTATAVLQQRAGDPVLQQAAAEARAAAQASYSPYTHCPSGVAIINRNGQVAAGGYIESAAHNPGLPPLQSAIAAAIIQGKLESYQAIKELVLVEVDGTIVRHERLIKAVAAAIDEDITVTVLLVHRL